MLTVGSLFAGIGGFDLGFERAGMRTVWFCEQDAYCQRVLAKHWPGVPIHDDVCALVADAESRRWNPPVSDDAAPGADDQAGSSGQRVRVPVPVPYVDILCGGFPCQDISVAGKGEGIDGARSGLWSQFARLIGELRPRYVVVENVPALLGRGAGRVLGDLAAVGYDAEYDCLPASAFGAPHRRDWFWLVAYPNGFGGNGSGPFGTGRQEPSDGGGGADLADPSRDLSAWSAPAGTIGQRARAGGSSGGTRDAAHPVVCPDLASVSQSDQRPVSRGVETGGGGNPWTVEPNVGRVAHGVPGRVDRLRALGNSLVPQIAQFIGERIIEWEAIEMRDVA